MSKKETNSFIFEGEKIQCDFFDEDNEEDKIEIKKFHNILTNSSPKIEEDDDNKDLNNITSVSETDKVYLGEVKDDTKKSQDSAYEIEDELNETSLTNKNSVVEEEKNPKDLDEILENNIINKNNDNNNILKNQIEINNLGKNNLNISNQILSKIDDDDFLINNKAKRNNKKSAKNEKNKRGSKNKNRNKSPIFLIRKIKKRSKKIQLLRKKKGLHIFRKKDPDTIRRKIKTYYHNYLLELLNSKLKILNLKKVNYNYEGIITNNKVNKKRVNKFLKFNNKFTTNVSININRSLLLKKISQILMEEPISSKYRAYDLKNNYYLTKYILSLKTIPDIIKILNCTYMENFNRFLKSPHFQNILNKIKNRDGELYMNQFKNVSNHFISYYNNAKSKKEPKKEIKKKIFYKDKNKKLNLSNDEYININNITNNIDNDKSSFKLINVQQMSDNSNVYNNMSLVEDFHEFFSNKSLGEDKSINEFGYEYSSLFLKKTKKFEFINSNDNINIDKEESFYYKNKSKYLDSLNYSFEGEKDYLLKNENNFFIGKKYDYDSFCNNNLSEVVEDGFIMKKSSIYEEDNSMTIYKKRTSDYSKTNESDYTSMKFKDFAYKNDINDQISYEKFRKQI